MRRFNIFLLAAIFAFGGWLFFQHYRIDGWRNIHITPREPSHEGDGNGWSQWRPPARNGQTLRIATMNVQVFGRAKSQKSHVMEILAEIARQFDVLAIQEIRSQDQDLMPRFVDLINANGRNYDYVIGPRLGSGSYYEQYAYIFDLETVDVDRTQIYTISDPHELMHREPLVAWFRARGPKPELAFTFSLVNFHIDPDEVDGELELLPQIYRIVRDDGRNEDDVILLGDFNANVASIEHMLQGSGMTWALQEGPTNTRGTGQYDNILFHSTATSEYVGRNGALDFVRMFNLTVDQALEVSDHLPVWAEFSRLEGGEKGRVADSRVATPATLSR